MAGHDVTEPFGREEGLMAQFGAGKVVGMIQTLRDAGTVAAMDDAEPLWRRRHERRYAEGLGRHRFADEGDLYPDRAGLHEEQDRLPGRYRLPIVLCDLEGLRSSPTTGSTPRDGSTGSPITQGLISGSASPWPAHGRATLRFELRK